ncbi:MAG: chorismate mutase [Myxococcales bacterium]|nr:chorismate mutase [Myxococcales bacterium]MCB9524234.1 chorismate mutase [Myxococcales bacterium]
MPDPTPDLIAELRAQVDAVDDRLLAALGERLALARALGDAKAARGLRGRDPARERAIVARLAAQGAVPPDLVSHVWAALFTASRWVQTDHPG